MSKRRRLNKLKLQKTPQRRLGRSKPAEIGVLLSQFRRRVTRKAEKNAVKGAQTLKAAVHGYVGQRVVGGAYKAFSQMSSHLDLIDDNVIYVQARFQERLVSGINHY